MLFVRISLGMAEILPIIIHIYPSLNFWSILKFHMELELLCTALMYLTTTFIIWWFSIVTNWRKTNSTENKQLTLTGSKINGDNGRNQRSSGLFFHSKNIFFWLVISWHSFCLQTDAPPGHSAILALREKYLPYEAFKEVDHAESNTSMGLCGIGIIVFCLVLLFVTDIVTLYRHMRMLCSNLKDGLHSWGCQGTLCPSCCGNPHLHPCASNLSVTQSAHLFLPMYFLPAILLSIMAENSFYELVIKKRWRSLNL